MKFLIADDHSLVRHGLLRIIKERWPDAEAIEASKDAEVFQAVETHSLDFMVLDLSMPGRGGLDILKQLKSNGLKFPVLILSMHPEEQYAVRVLRAGASGFLNKDSAPELLINALERVLAGRKYVSDAVAEQLASGTQYGNSQALHENLSDRELEVLQQLAKGKTVSEIATELSLSVNTISTYRARILEKLGLESNAALTRYAIDNGLA
jgi:DNA-binding NarL/FixJ family response regulator